MIKKLFVIILLVFCLQSTEAQEVLSGLPYNPLLTSIDIPQKQQTLSSTLLELPFFDDFSNNSVFPNDNLWDSNDGASSVFINNSYGKGLVSVGVATFDAVNQNGVFTNEASSSPYLSDELKSYNIDLSNADIDSLYLSFYYQPQGNGNAPEPNDSLILQVTAGNGIWETVWYANGMEFNDFRKKIIGLDENIEGDFLEFDYVMVKLDSLKYKTADFKFRFKNYASLSADHAPSAAVNCDHWNIDYVYLNDGRDPNDLPLFDVACIEPPSLFLRDYEAVPWTHYYEVQRTELAKKDILARNNDQGPIPQTITPVELLIEDLATHTIIDSVYIASWDIDPERTERYSWKYEKDPLFKVKDVDEFNFRYHLRFTFNDSVPQNNTASKIYHFTNYYAYDDGVAENAYGVEANGAKVAYKFNSFIPDTLKGISMYFLPTHPEGEGATSFNICVWASNSNGLPGDLILKDEGIAPEFEGKLNKFHEYELSTYLPVYGDFFIGWEQKSDLRLNVGFDLNNISSENLYYNIFGNWENTLFDGSLMMRPLLGHLKPNAIKVNKSAANNLTIYPNPTSNFINFLGVESEEIQSIRIFNSVGKLMYQQKPQQESVDVSFLENGVYIISITDIEGVPYTSRFIISK